MKTMMTVILLTLSLADVATADPKPCRSAFEVADKAAVLATSVEAFITTTNQDPALSQLSWSARDLASRAADLRRVAESRADCVAIRSEVERTAASFQGLSRTVMGRSELYRNQQATYDWWNLEDAYYDAWFEALESKVTRERRRPRGNGNHRRP